MTIMRASSHRMIKCHSIKFIDQNLIALLVDIYCSRFVWSFLFLFIVLAFAGVE